MIGGWILQALKAPADTALHTEIHSEGLLASASSSGAGRAWPTSTVRRKGMLTGVVAILYSTRERGIPGRGLASQANPGLRDCPAALYNPPDGVRPVFFVPQVPTAMSAATPKSKILIADDNAPNVELLEAYLSGVDCEIAVAVDGRDTLEKVAAFSPT